MSIINTLVEHGHSHESELFADVIASHNEIVASLESHNRELLAVSQVLREALNGLTVACRREFNTKRVSDWGRLYKAEEAIKLKPGDIALVEVGYASLPSIQNLINGNDVIVGKKNDIRTEAVYTIQTKSNTE